jgi:hypothetical protein
MRCSLTPSSPALWGHVSEDCQRGREAERPVHDAMRGASTSSCADLVGRYSKWLSLVRLGGKLLAHDVALA